MLGPFGEIVKVVLAIGSMVDLFGNSTIKFLGSDNFSCSGTSDIRINVSVAPVSPMVGIIANGWGGGVELRCKHVEIFFN